MRARQSTNDNVCVYPNGNSSSLFKGCLGFELSPFRHQAAYVGVYRAHAGGPGRLRGPTNHDRILNDSNEPDLLYVYI